MKITVEWQRGVAKGLILASQECRFKRQKLCAGELFPSWCSGDWISIGKRALVQRDFSRCAWIPCVKPEGISPPPLPVGRACHLNTRRGTHFEKKLRFPRSTKILRRCCIRCVYPLVRWRGTKNSFKKKKKKRKKRRARKWRKWWTLMLRTKRNRNIYKNIQCVLAGI